MRKVTVLRMRERYAQTVFTFRIPYVNSAHNFLYLTKNCFFIKKNAFYGVERNLIVSVEFIRKFSIVTVNY